MRLKFLEKDWTEPLGRHWLAWAVALRIIASLTRVKWHYPDEWYQTIEFSRLLLGKNATFSHEMALHLRNLSWPAMLAVPEWLSGALAPHWTRLRVISAQLLSGAFDLGALWAFSRLSRAWPERWRNLGFALLVFAWFRVQDSVSLGAEHICVCLIWMALALLESPALWARWLAGVLTVGIFAVKYPAGLVSLGFTVGAFAQAIRRKQHAGFGSYLVGMLSGTLIFGAADWVFYGRPWESLWMYLQYNVFTGSGARDFGQQGIGEYFDFFQSRWLRVLLPFGVALVFFGGAAVYRAARRWEPWVLAFLAYFIGHLIISHREGRFMYPAEALLVFGCLKYLAETRATWTPSRWVVSLMSLAWIANTPLFLKAAIGETGTLNASYMEIDRRIRENPETCAVITMRKLSSLLIPGETGRDLKPSFGFFSAERRIPTFEQASFTPLGWYEQAPNCGGSDAVLLLVDRPDVGWVESGCRLQRSGVLEILPQRLWFPFLRRGWVSGPWYACPPSILSHFPLQLVEKSAISELVRFPSLPPYGITADQLREFRNRSMKPKTCPTTCP